MIFLLHYIILYIYQQHLPRRTWSQTSLWTSLTSSTPPFTGFRVSGLGLPPPAKGCIAPCSEAHVFVVLCRVLGLRHRLLIFGSYNYPQEQLKLPFSARGVTSSNFSTVGEDCILVSGAYAFSSPAWKMSKTVQDCSWGSPATLGFSGAL